MLALIPLAADPEPGALEHATFDLVNHYRTQHGLPPMAWNAAVAAQALRHSRDMASGACDFGHDGFGDRVDALRDQLTGLGAAGENVFETSDPSDLALSAVNHWLNSPPHLHNIRGDFTLSGLGIARSPDGVWYFTQIFIKIRPPAPLPPAPADSSVTGLPFAPAVEIR